MSPHRTRVLRPALVLAVALTVSTLAGCSSSSDGGTTKATTTTPTGGTGETTTTAPRASRPAGPGAEFSPLSGGKGIALAAATTGPPLSTVGYAEAEYEAAGTATAYRSKGDLPADGRFQLEPSTSADYATRVVVRRPDAGTAFNGTVVIEWLNVSGGADAAPDYTYLSAELLRSGYAWVGVSAQRIGIEGGPVAVEAPGADITGAGRGIKKLDPARYSKLSHPGDAYSYDIFTQVARGLRKPGKVDPLGGLGIKQVLAVGESQSAFALTTYVDGVQPLTHEFDGFLIHSRGGAAAPLGQPGEGIDIAGTIGGKATKIRTDLDVPTIVVETESDVLGILGYYPARQPDADELRVWEVAGTAHADKFQIGSIEPMLGCKEPINRGQQSYVLKAALAHLGTWAAGGDAPPKGTRLATDDSGAKPTYVLDGNGNVEGGVRTPAVDAPVDVLSGLAVPDATIICVLMGSTRALPAATLAKDYASRQAYLDDYAKAADAAIDVGFVLAADRKALLADAQPDRIAG